MSVTFLLGGARSGKSALAVELAARGDGPVTFLATAEPRDEEMAERIHRHRAERPEAWSTVEEPIELEASLAAVADDAVVVVDCVSLWVANLLERAADDVEARNDGVLERAKGRGAQTIVVSNEVGLGVVPASELGRRYRDVLGRVNARWAAAADEAFFVVAGRALRLR